MLNLAEISEIKQERRRRRTDIPELAMGYQLDEVARDFHLDCCLIVDDAGRVLATSPEASTPFMQSLAALLPAMATIKESRAAHLDQLRKRRPSLDDDELTTCAFRAGGRRLYIAAVGSEAVMNEVAIFRAIIGTRRIHGQ